MAQQIMNRCQVRGVRTRYGRRLENGSRFNGRFPEMLNSGPVDSFVVRRAVVSEQKELEALQLRASLTNVGDRDSLLANPDAIELPLQQIAGGGVFFLSLTAKSWDLLRCCPGRMEMQSWTRCLSTPRSGVAESEGRWSSIAPKSLAHTDPLPFVLSVTLTPTISIAFVVSTWSEKRRLVSG